MLLLDPRLNDELIVESADIEYLLKNRSQPLLEEWLGTPIFQEQLLHELVHHVQYQSGAVDQFPCPADGEK